MPLKHRILTVSPKLAQEWLDKSNTRNRNILGHVVDKYARDMANDRWAFTGDPIQFDEKGVLLNGQHRLSAVIKSNTVQKFMVVEGLESGSQDMMDGGAVRRTGQQLVIHGIKNGAQATGIVNLLLRWNSDALSKAVIYSTPEVLEFIYQDEDLIAEAIEYYYTIGRAIPLSRAAIGAFAYKLLKLATEYPEFTPREKVEEFLNKMATGENLDAQDPILVLRNHAMRSRAAKQRRHAMRDLYYLVRTWNAYAEGERYARLAGPRDGTITPNHLILRHADKDI